LLKNGLFSLFDTLGRFFCFFTAESSGSLIFLSPDQIVLKLALTTAFFAILSVLMHAPVAFWTSDRQAH
jgi:hypothetical protein